MNMGRPCGPIVRWILGPIRWSTIVLVVLFCLWLLWEFRRPGPYYMGDFVAGFFVTIMFLARLFWSGIRSAVADFYLQPYKPSLRTRRGLWLGILLFGTMTLTLLRIPLYVSFAISKPAMDRFLRELNENPTAPRPTVQWVGLYPLRTTPVRYENIVRIYFTDSLEEGFAYSEEPIGYGGMNRGAGGYLWGNWHWFSDD